ncbi:sialate O-acetylesterase [Coraliomargarita sp. SDUM461004]|uniref:Sialate O-acetylesterase n=1 Tax=Thalassobacterium sedimentorum TaxID=3041258 RepID=A0ABU1AJ56_9BACT|nr:sialate O-acetylesterase [Coraliomargarita sp. SDUM461004]MDQ8194803.1 sialate O-acetylesterase [Coraliomargarita sp. SDUM461004]
MILGTQHTLARVSLSALFTDGMVLQNSTATSVWGYASTEKRVTVSLGELSQQAKVDRDGRWLVRLDLTDLGVGPHELSIIGDDTLVIRDVLIGQVWLASGQSNMARTLYHSRDAEAFADPANDMIRIFAVERNPSIEPTEKIVGQWYSFNKNTRTHFSSVAYYFARKLQAELGVPVAVIHASWPGTNIDSWIGLEALQSGTRLKRMIEPKLRSDRDFPEQKKLWLEATKAWLVACNREDVEPDVATVEAFAVQPIVADVDGWTTVKMPKLLKGGRVLWLRRDVSVSKSQQGKDFAVNFDEIVGIDTIFWDGIPVAGRTLESFGGSGFRRRDVLRQYHVPAELVTEGTHTLAVRLYSPWDQLGFGRRSLSAGGKAITGEWFAKTERSFDPIPADVQVVNPSVFRAPLRLFNVPSSLYNGMIHPLLSYRIKGVIWYQGENDAKNADNYRFAFPLMIREWRKAWNQPDLAFYWCQIPNYGSKKDDPAAESNWAEIRAAQSIALDLPNTGQAILLDAGEAGDIHPSDKRIPGARLAAIALAKSYGQDRVYSGPQFKSMAIEGARVRVTFSHTGSGLLAQSMASDYLYKSLPGPDDRRPLIRNSPQSEIEGFAIQGEDRVWHWANAQIDGVTVVVHSPAVPQPVAVRYAWADSPTFNLYNLDGFPASPFWADRDESLPAFP